MKTCRNCRCVWPDDYNGQCADCGAPMAGIAVNGGDDLMRRYAQQRSMGLREAQSESALKGGRHGDVQVHEAVLDRALAMLTPKPGAFDDE